MGAGVRRADGCQDREATFGLATRVKEEFGVEIPVLNVAVTTAGPLVDHIPEEWGVRHRVWWTGDGLPAFLTAMIEQGHGHIVVTSSMVGLVPDYFILHGP